MGDNEGTGSVGTTAPAAPPPAAPSTGTDTGGSDFFTREAGPGQDTSTKVFRGMSMDKILDLAEEHVTREVEATAGKEQEPGISSADEKTDVPKVEGQKVAEPKPPAQVAEPKDLSEVKEEMLPAALREQLKGVQDPRWRRRMTEDYFVSKAYRNCGVRMGDAKEYGQIAPTVEVLRNMRDVNQAVVDLKDALGSGTSEGVDQFLGALHQTNPQAVTNLAAYIVGNAETLFPRMHTRMGDQITRNVIANARREANNETNPNPDLAFAVDVIAKWLGHEKGDGQEKKQELPPEVFRELEEARQLKVQAREREAAEAQQRYEAFSSAAYTGARDRVVDDLTNWIERYGTAYNDSAKAELFDRIGGQLQNSVLQNKLIRNQLDSLISAGVGDQEHYDRVVNFLYQNAVALLPNVAHDVFTDFNSMFNVRQAKREERVARHVERKDVGSGGGVPAPVVRSVSGKGKTSDQVLDEFEKARGF